MNKTNNYCELTTENKHVKKLIEWLIEEVLSAGGDGDGIWYSGYFLIEDIKKIIESMLPKTWSFTEYNKNEGYFVVGHNQEGLIVTNNREIFRSRPNWQQVAIDY